MCGGTVRVGWLRRARWFSCLLFWCSFDACLCQGMCYHPFRYSLPPRVPPDYCFRYEKARALPFLPHYPRACVSHFTDQYAL